MTPKRCRSAQVFAALSLRAVFFVLFAAPLVSEGRRPAFSCRGHSDPLQSCFVQLQGSRTPAAIVFYSSLLRLLVVRRDLRRNFGALHSPLSCHGADADTIRLDGFMRACASGHVVFRRLTQPHLCLLVVLTWSLLRLLVVRRDSRCNFGASYCPLSCHGNHAMTR